MDWDSIHSQEFVVRVLRSHLVSKRVAPTYLFTGPAYSGKEEMARTFACALNCEAGHVFQPCSCASCIKIEKGVHPDVRRIGDAEAKSIKIEEIRDMIKWAYLKPYEGLWKVFVFEGSERLTLEASNALLKTLEEPPAQTVFCLLVVSKSHLLETIQSRAFELRFWPGAGHDQTDLAGLKSSLRENRAGNWEDFFESYVSLERSELHQLFSGLMAVFRERLQEITVGGSYPAEIMRGYLSAIDTLYETREALEANANAKLALSRLAMQLRRILPKAKLVS